MSNRRTGHTGQLPEVFIKPFSKRCITAGPWTATFSPGVYAELAGCSASQFLVYAAKKEAQETKRQALQVQVSRQRADRMLELLDNPEPINSSLREAALNHRKLAGDFNKSCPISMCKPCFSSI